VQKNIENLFIIMAFEKKKKKLYLKKLTNSKKHLSIPLYLLENQVKKY
jgi:hypothetical protein